MTRPEERTYAWEIEQKLLRRMERRYEEQRASKSIAEFFENERQGNVIPVVLGLGKRKNRTVKPDGGGVLGAPAGGRLDRQEIDSPPTANRGVTFHENENNPEVCPYTMGGYDGGVEVGFDGEWQKYKFSALEKVLSAAKQAAQDNTDGKYFEIGGRTFEMNNKSAGGFTTYKYVFEGGGIKFYIHNNPQGDIQPVRIRYNAESLIGNNLFNLHNETVAFLTLIGFSVSGEKLSRVDMQVMVLRDISEFIEYLGKRQYVCTARNYALHGSSANQCPDTFRLGSDIQICIYDKRQELFAHCSKEPLKFSLMVKYCFGEDWLLQDVPATRVEFRLRRDVLKDMGINTVSDLQEYEAGLARYCCNSWFRLLKDERKKGHTNEQEVAPIWVEVQELFEQYFPDVQENKPVVRKRGRLLLCSASKLIQQGVGCFATAAALLLGAGLPADDIVRSVKDFVDVHRIELVQRTCERAKDVSVRSGFYDDAYNPASAFVPVDRERISALL